MHVLFLFLFVDKYIRNSPLQKLLQRAVSIFDILLFYGAKMRKDLSKIVRQLRCNLDPFPAAGMDKL